jgi:hypothetical protein
MFEVDIHELIRNLHCMFVTPECRHDQKTPRLLLDDETEDMNTCKPEGNIGTKGNKFHTHLHSRLRKDHRGDAWVVGDVIHSWDFPAVKEKSDRIFYIFPVSGHLISQWASSCMAGWWRDNILIFQDMMCLDCIAEVLSDGPWKNIAVITQV